ncbi:MAG: aminotransferase class I/II-fold pyridoxal phosphate-dependent enzyme [Candidatus Zixiibacteriota bacterium]|nr:MAG: aminotransferase class I/II-fold pyridoxal phosphate-dependent enzyme [candidate division Zixibacteria bacterium]
MSTSDIVTIAENNQLVDEASKKAGVTTDMALGFRDLTGFLEEYLKTFCRQVSRLVCAGHISPDVAAAADRADLEVVEALGESPFSGDVRPVRMLIEKPNDIIYLANPNRITGASFSVRDLQDLAAAVPEGSLIIDEHFFEYFGITGLPLLKNSGNVVLLRPLASPPRVGLSDAGFAVANKQVAARMKKLIKISSIPSATRHSLLPGLIDTEASAARVKETHDESLRLALSLTRLGIQCRLSATNFMLFRVAHPKDVGNSLVSSGVSVENLDGYPMLKNYMRYQVATRNANDRFVEAFKQMPERHFKMPGYDFRAAIQRRKPLMARLPRPKQGCETAIYTRKLERYAAYEAVDK